jgi:CheY-like chemotaxis protein
MSLVKKIVQSLEGEIYVDSEINQGTQVTVHFPLNPVTSHPDVSQQTIAQSKISPNPVSMLRVECPDKTVAFFGFETVSTILLKDSVQFYITEWYHFSIIRDVHRADFVIVDETSLDDLFARFAATDLPRRIVALRSTTIRDKSLPAAINSILKPVGPYVLAKVLLNCWTRTPPSTPDEVPLATMVEQRHLALHNDRNEKQLAATPVKETQYPSPATVEPKLIETTITQDSSITAEPELVSSPEPLPPPVAPKSLEIHAPRKPKKKPEVSVSVVEIEQLRILCVDDNPINLKVLQAYLKKLDKKNVIFAENGLEAFKAVESSDTPFDLIFMGRYSHLVTCIMLTANLIKTDLSMPVCDGFESTARIRKLEKQRHKLLPVGGRSSFIIALTGQASSRDQDQAFASGVDKFVTKPMSLSHLKALLYDLEVAGKLRGSQVDSEEKHWCDVEEETMTALG